MPTFAIFFQSNQKRGNFGTTFFAILKDKRIKTATGVAL